MATKRTITELIRRELSGGFPSDYDRVKDAEIMMHIGSIGNQLIKAEYYNTTMNIEGETIPDGCMIGTYYVKATKAPNNFASVTLPIVPMTMPRRMGVFSVEDKDMNEFIPIPMGMYSQIKKDKLLNSIDSQCYSWSGNTITIYKDLVGSGQLDITLRLCVLDIDAYGEYEVLPLPQDLISQVVEKIVALYQGESKADRIEGGNPK